MRKNAIFLTCNSLQFGNYIMPKLQRLNGCQILVCGDFIPTHSHPNKNCTICEYDVRHGKLDGHNCWTYIIKLCISIKR